MGDPDVAIEAAGGVLWRPATGEASGVEIAVVHRPKYDDWSIPKGKLEPGEYPLLGALRELREETGFEAVPGRFVGEVRYSFRGRPKRVRYWAMRPLGGSFVSGDEVDELVWVPLPQVAERVDTDGDRQIVEAFAADTRATSACVVARALSTDLLSPAVAQVVQAFQPIQLVFAGVGHEFDELATGLARQFGGGNQADIAVVEGGFVVLHVAGADATELVAIDSYPPAC